MSPKHVLSIRGLLATEQAYIYEMPFSALSKGGFVAGDDQGSLLHERHLEMAGKLFIVRLLVVGAGQLLGATVAKRTI